MRKSRELFRPGVRVRKSGREREWKRERKREKERKEDEGDVEKEKWNGNDANDE